MESVMAGTATKGADHKAPGMIPLLSACFAELRAKGLHELRVFQHTASLTEVRQLWQDICEDGLHKLKEQESPHLIAGLVMWHLKRQPEPLVPYSLYPLVVAAGAGAAAAAEAAARRARFPDEDAQEDEVDDDVDDDERDDVDDEEDGLDEEADRGGGRGAGVEEGGARGGSGAAVAKALAAVASVAKKGSDSGSPRSAGKAESNREAGQRKDAQPAGEAAVDAKSTLGGSLDVARSASPTLVAAENADTHERMAAGRPGVLETTVEVAGAAAAVGRSNLATEVNPGSVWEQGVPGECGMEWGRPTGTGTGGGKGGAGVGVGARGLEGARAGGGDNVGGGSPSEEAGNEWDAGDGTVALRHLQNLAAQLPYSAWQVLCLILEFLAQVAALSKVNETTTEVLAQTFAPVLCRPQGSAFMSLRHVQDLLKIQAVVRVLIENHAILSQNRTVSSNHGSAGSKALLSGQSKGAGKDGLNLTLSAGGRRASSNDLYIVQQLINDSVSLLVYSGDDYGVGEEGDGGGRGSGKRRSRGDSSGHQGRLRSFLRPHMLRAPPPPPLPSAHFSGPASLSSGSAGPSYLRKHSFFDLDEDDDDEEYNHSHNASKKSEEDATVKAEALTSASSVSAGAIVVGSSSSAISAGQRPGSQAISAADVGVSAAVAPSPAYANANANSNSLVREGLDSNRDSVGAGGGGSYGGSTVEPLGRRGRKSVAGALERRRVMQACKALHAQIKHYNTSFQKEYGHPPRRRERVPLVSTYAQYKSWRHFICDDASTQLQSFYRGYRERKRHPEVPRLLRRQAPPPPPPHFPSTSSSSPASAASPPRLVPIGVAPLSPSAQASATPSIVAAAASSATASSKRVSATANTAPSSSAILSPEALQSSKQAASFAVTSSGGVLVSSAAATGGAAVMSASGGDGVDGSAGGGVAGGADEEARAALTAELKELLEEKRATKSQLKDFDKSFCKRTGRNPSKAEKEPMRHLYDLYNGIKHQIRDVEGLLVSHRQQQHSPQLQFTPPQSPYTASPRGGRNTSTGSDMTSSASAVGNSTNGSSTVNAKNATNGGTSTSNCIGGGSESAARWNAGATTTTVTTVSMNPSGSGSNVGVRAGAVVGSPISIAGAVAASTAAAATAAVSAASAAAAVANVGDGGRSSGSGAGGGGGAEKVEQLKKEKRSLHVMLKNFEKEFKEKNGREVSCPEDIAPVEADYQRYKMIKKRLAQLIES